MPIELAQGIVTATGLYLAAGVVYALAHAFVLVGKADPAADGASIWFRLIILPGVAALWPVLLVHTLRGRRADHS